MSKGTIYFATILFILLGCKDSNNPLAEELAAMQRSEIETFLADNDLEATRHDDGFYYIITQEDPVGKTQVAGNVLSVYYTMNVLDGQEVSFVRMENGDPFRLKQGASAVVPVGLDTGLGLMKEGETYRFILPAALAFGNLEFSTLIPINSIIDIEVELVSIESENDILLQEIDAINDYINTNNLNNLTISPEDSVEVLSSELRYKRTAEGTDGDSPANGDIVTITYTGTFLNDNQFDATTGNDTFEFSLGAGEVILGLEEGITQMERGERALLIMPSSIAYRESVRVIPDFLIDDMIERQVVPDYVDRVPPYQVLIFNVRLTQ